MPGWDNNDCTLAPITACSILLNFVETKQLLLGLERRPKRARTLAGRTKTVSHLSLSNIRNNYSHILLTAFLEDEGVAFDAYANNVSKHADGNAEAGDVGVIGNGYTCRK